MTEISIDEYFAQADKSEKVVQKNLPRILLKGPCDLRSIKPLLESAGSVDIETNYLGQNGVDFHQINHTVHILESLELDDLQIKNLSETLPFIDENCFNTKIFSGNYQIIFLSALLESSGFVYRNVKTGIRVVFAFELDLTDEKNWSDIISGKGGLQWQVKFDYKFFEYFKTNYKAEGFLEPKTIVENYKKIRSLIPEDTLLILSLGSTNFYKTIDTSKIQRRKEINLALEREFSNVENVKLFKYEKYITSANDLTDMTDHFQRRIYFEIATDMVKIANEYLKNRGWNTEINVKPKQGIKTLLWSATPFNYKLYEFIKQAEDKDFINIVGYAIFENNQVKVYEKLGGKIIAPPPFQIIVVADENNFYEHSQALQNLKIPANLIVDDNVFKLPNLNIPRLVNERVAYCNIDGNEFSDESRTIYRRVCIVGGNVAVILGRKSYVKKISFIKDTSVAEIRIGNYTSIGDNVKIYLRDDNQNVSNYYRQSSIQTVGKINIGSDVKIYPGATLISKRVEDILTIGDGAIIEENSVVTKSVPPYAIVAGNPAQIIDYRFPQEIILQLQKIKWWDWDFDKIQKYFPYFSDIKKFLSGYNEKS